MDIYILKTYGNPDYPLFLQTSHSVYRVPKVLIGEIVHSIPSIPTSQGIFPVCLSLEPLSAFREVNTCFLSLPCTFRMCSSPFGFQVCLHLNALPSSESHGFMSALFPPKELTPPSQIFLLESTALLIVKRVVFSLTLIN